MKLKRMPGLLSLIVLFFILLSCQPQRPNVILIMADDMGAECLSMYGGISYHTPRLEEMAQEGMVVERCIAQPLCTPSRVKLMTGLSNARNYTHFGRLDTTWLNMGTLMREAGYRTCITGKWQLNGLAYKDQFPDWKDAGRPHQMGFDEHCLWQLTHGRSEGERFADPLIEQNGEVMDTDLDDYGPDIFANYALEFIGRNSKEPFFIYYPMVLVHEPFVPTPDSRDWRKREERYRNDPAYFSDMMNYADQIVGRIMQKLEAEGIADNTLLIFTADNGTDRQIISLTKDRQVKGAKGSTINDGVHVPLLIRWPRRVEGGSHWGGLVEFSDFFATLAELVGREVECDGVSFLPLLEGKAFQGRCTASVHYDPRWGAWVNAHRNSFVQTLDYKLYQDDSFFDLREDVMERRPLDLRKLTTSQKEAYRLLQAHRPAPVPPLAPESETP